MAFARAANENETLKSALNQHVVLLKLDAEKGEGVDIARSYNVRGFPSFILTDAAGATYDRWMGYGDPDVFIETMTTATADPITVGDRMNRFRKEKGASDAMKIGELRGYEGMAGEALAWYERAHALDPSMDVAVPVFRARGSGYRWGLFDLASVGAAGEAVIATGDVNGIREVVGNLDRMTRRDEDRSVYLAAVKSAASQLDGMHGEGVDQTRAMVMVEYALHIDGKPEEAFEWKKRSLPEGWQDDANQLNNIAWWCFENQTALDEAETYARKAITMAESGNELGNVLDTLAEICNLKGDCGEAVELMRQAVAEDPDSEYFQKQLARFEKLLAEQQG